MKKISALVIGTIVSTVAVALIIKQKTYKAIIPYCKACKGNGYTLNDIDNTRKAILTCPTCDGSGRPE